MSDVTDFLGTLDRLKEIATTPDANQGVFYGAIKASVNAQCAAYAKAPQVVNNAGLGPLLLYNELCAPVFAAAGATPPVIGSPFLGGQCDNRLYDVTFFRVRDGFPQTTDTYSVYGPVVEAYAVYNDTTPPTYSVFHYVRARPAPGAPVTLIEFGPASTPDPNSKLLGVSPNDGLEDNCGNPPVQFTPGVGMPDIDFGDTVVYSPYPGVDVPITVNPPTVNPDGTIEIDIEPGGTPFQVEPLAEFPPEGETSPGDELPGDDLDANNGDFPPPPDGFEYIGCIVFIEGPDDVTGLIPQAEPFRVFTRTVGNARLKLTDDNGNSYLDRSTRLEAADTTLVRPEAGIIVKGVRVNRLPRLSYSVTPLLKALPDT